MEKDYLEILASMRARVKENDDWMDWKCQIENLIRAAIEIVHSKEDWPTHTVLNAALETINSEKGELLERLFRELDWGNRKKDINSELDFHNGKVDYSSEMEIIRAKLKAAADDVINKFKLDWGIKEEN